MPSDTPAHCLELLFSSHPGVRTESVTLNRGVQMEEDS
jgi:hypothetical protein